jgi:hypothetical protein
VDPNEEPPDWLFWSLVVALLQLELELLEFLYR